MLLQAEYWTAR